MIGRTIGHYRIVARIGEGGMGVVFRARDEHLQRDVAFKVLTSGLLADDRARRRFRQEALALSKLNHPNIQTVHDFDTQDEIDFLVTEYVEGVTLSVRVAAGALPEKDVLWLGAQLVDGLAAAHAEAIIHRDVKPDNLRVTPEGRLKILDFGLAHRLLMTGIDATTQSVADAGALAGTLPYMAPEQLLGETVDARTDVFAAGCVLYELSTGRRAFADHLTPKLTDAILHEAPVAPRAVNPQVSAELERIVLKCLEKDPNERYQSATELSVDLRRLQSGRVAAAVVSAEGGRQPRRWIIWVSAIAMALVALGLAASSGRWAASSGPIQSVAVLPLSNLMGAEDQEYYVAAMHEALIAELGQISALTVISRTSVMRYRTATDKSVPEIARELNVDALVTGSIFKAGDRVRVQVQLIRATPAERQLWSRTFDGELQDVMALQKETARAIAGQMQLTITPQEATRLATARRVDPAAYDAWAQGSFQFSRNTVEGLHKCVEHAAEALAIDSRYAPAYALTALCQGVLPNLGGGAPHDLYPMAAAAARRALDLDDSIADAHVALGWTLAAYDWDWAGAEREYRRGLELNPGSAFGHSRFGWFLGWMSRDEEAVAEVKRGLELNPTGTGEMSRASAIHFVARRYDDAILAGRRTIEIDPLFAFGYHRLGQPALEKGMYEEGIAALEKAVQLSVNVNHKGTLGRGYALSGRLNDARRVLEALLSPGEHSDAASLQIAQIYVSLGEKEEALHWLEQGYRLHDGDMPLLRVFPAWDSLRSDPRFQNLLQRMKFP